MLLETELEGVVGRLTQEVDALDTVATALVDSDALPRLLALILEVGNFFNTGSAGGEAVGFTLQSLLNITDTKSSTGTDTLLDHLAAHVAEEMPETVEEAKELYAVLGCSQKKMSDLTMTIAEVHALYRKILDHKTTSDALDFTRDYDSFFEYALGTTSALKDITDTLREKADTLCEMYVEKKVADIVDPVRQFFGKFVAAVDASAKAAVAAADAEAAAATLAEAEAAQAKQAKKEARQAERRRKFQLEQEAMDVEKRQQEAEQAGQQGGGCGGGGGSSSSGGGSASATQVTGPGGSKLTQRGSWTVDEETGMLQNLDSDAVPRSKSSPATNGGSITRTRTKARRRRAVSTTHSVRVVRCANNNNGDGDGDGNGDGNGTPPKTVMEETGEDPSLAESI